MPKTLSLPGNPDSLDPLAEFLAAASKEAGLNAQQAYRLHLAVDEVVTNIIVHGYEENGLHGDVALSVEMDPKSLTIIVEDTAPAFDPTQAKPPEDLSRPLEERALGGLGIFLAMRSVDKFTYERMGNRNRNIFVVSRSSSAAEPDHS